MSQKNKNLNAAKAAKNDEFYTRIEDIEAELQHYVPHFENKIVFCNCDDPVWSEFWHYFHINFTKLKLKKLVSTHYNRKRASYKLEYMGGNDDDINCGIKTKLTSNGDFRSDACVELLKEADIIVTNPPFSLFREYVAQLIEYNKKFIIIGNLNAVKYKDIFPYIATKQLWLGHNTVKIFKQPNGSLKRFGNIGWYTNLDLPKRHTQIVLTKRFAPDVYSKYDTYDAIEVNRVENIPIDYDGIMGVPISFMNKYSPDQFEIVGEFNHGCDNEYDLAKPVINGKVLFPRIAIRRVVK